MTAYQTNLHAFIQAAEAQGLKKLAESARVMLECDVKGERVRQDLKRRGFIGKALEIVRTV